MYQLNSYRKKFGASFFAFIMVMTAIKEKLTNGYILCEVYRGIQNRIWRWLKQPNWTGFTV